MNFDLTTLNDEQLKPVLDTEGAVLVTAGAGSGKTRLLTHRIAYILDRGLAQRYNVLAITFTNKAAGEMRQRLSDMIDGADQIWIFTFHALCVRILRKFICKIDGYSSNFSIYGENEKNNCIKRIVKGFIEKGKISEPGDYEKIISGCISKAKENGYTPSGYAAVNKFMRDIDLIAEAYELYENEKKRCNSLDYDDLLLFAYNLLSDDEEVRSYYQKKFKYIHIDEFQDTNTIQYNLAKILSGGYGNIFAVGDEDQSIYGWRGANFENIFNFQKDFSCKVYKLEQNYRSTKNIIDIANKIIVNNKTRLEKVLWTENEKGDKVECHCANTDRDEVNFVIKKIAQLRRDNGYFYRDFAVLMRVNSLSRQFEEGFLTYNIPHKVYGGFKFYERKEIKDVLAYLRIMVNPSDNDALLRIINFPRRGIGESTVAQLVNYCNVTGSTMYDVVLNIDKNEDLPIKITKKLSPLAEVLKCLENAYNTGATASNLGKYVVKVLNLKEYYRGDEEENVNRRMNIKELLNGMDEFDKQNGGTLEDYLQTVSLYSDTDEEDDGDSITISTVHSAKGLEFKTVFLVGMEDGIFPSSSRTEADETEEERRLMYVAVTRAREKLFMTYTVSRYRFNKITESVPSRFLKEAGFETERPKPVSNSNYYDRGYGGNGVYRGSRAYAKSYGDSYNREEVPVFDTYVPNKKVAAPKGKDASAYVVGARVSHSKFGNGTITAVKKLGSDICLDIEFDKMGKLALLLNYAPIEIIGE